MTNYVITLGYRSGSKSNHSEDEAWDILKSSVSRLRNAPLPIVTEVRRVEPEFTESDLRPFADAYSSGHDDLTLTIDEPNRRISQLASGDRKTKEAVRRAFCRLIVESMHWHGIEVCLNVM